MTANYDVIVVGAGNAAFCAAHAAREADARVVMLERAPETESGGNSRFTAGAIRFAYGGVDDLKSLMPDLSEDEIATTDFGRYTEDQFFDDMARLTQYRADPDLVDVLVRRSLDTMRWLRAKGLRFAPMYGRQAFKIDGRFRFWGGLTVEVWGGGPGLVARHAEIAQAAGIEIRYGTRASGLLHDGIRVSGVRYRSGAELGELRAPAVVLACGGFEANSEMRHAVGWDRNAPEFGDLAVGDAFPKHSYPFGIMVNARGERFVDEGADLRNYTYAKYGHEILRQPQQFAWQIFDGKVLHLLRDEYRIRQVTRARADTLDDLAGKLEGVDPQRFLETVRAFNAAIRTEVPFDPNVKDGRGTDGIWPPKSNWANPLDTPPFEAYQVTCGITFTFGGLRIDGDARVLDTDLQPIPGLYAAGELVGGLFYFNYPGGTGLMSGAVFGRTAGASAARLSFGR